nr:hypothetical protein [Tanacetum cinerariifolium]
MADQRTMAELLRAPTERYAEVIVVPSILAEQFELKHSLINMMTTDQFFRLEKDNPHDHICWGSPPMARKRTLAFYHTWEDLVSKFINEFFSPSRTTNLRNEIFNFQQRFDESFHEAWDRYKDLLRACPHHGSGSLPSNTIANPKGELKAITTRSAFVLDGSTVPTPLLFNNPEEDERVEETLIDLDLSKYTIKVPASPVQKYKPPSQREYVVHQRDPLHPNIPYPLMMLNKNSKKKMKSKSTNFALLSNKEKLQELENTPLNKKCLTVILKKLPVKLRDPGKFLILYGFSELKCKALANLDLFPTNHQSGNPTFSSHPDLTSSKVKDDIFDQEGGNVLNEKLLDLDSTKDLLPPHNINPLNGSTTSSSPNHLLEEFADEFALITFLSGNDDLPFDIDPLD